MAATEIAYLLLWCCVLPEKRCSGRNRSRIPSQSMGSAGVAPDSSMASEASSRSSSAGKVLYRMCRAPSLERISSDSSPDARPARAMRIASLRSSGVGCLFGAIASTVDRRDRACRYWPRPGVGGQVAGGTELTGIPLLVASYLCRNSMPHEVGPHAYPLIPNRRRVVVTHSLDLHVSSPRDHLSSMPSAARIDQRVPASMNHEHGQVHLLQLLVT